MLKQVYTPDEAEHILTEAVRRTAETEAAQATGQSGVPHERLVAMAEELGVSPETLAAVLEEQRAHRATQEQQAAAQQAEQQERREFITERRADFYPHLWSYIGVNIMLIAINLLTSRGHFWAAYPLLGWGIGLFCHAMAALPTRGPEFDKAFAGWREARRKKSEKARKAEQAKQRREGRRAAAAEASKTAASATGSGARAYDSPGNLAADAVQQAAGAIQQAVGEVAQVVDDALRSSGAADWRATTNEQRSQQQQQRRR
jgi:pyruvate/2-oxoglutarate dehydrogenase complex dihydrolipoamide acyltransferase (E2) component